MEYPSFQSIVVYISLFIATYFEVFLMLTLVEHKNRLKKENATMDDAPKYFPTATIIVPCFNEEKTVDGTIQSLLAMNYPKDKLNIIVVDDGSTDNTWSFIQQYSDHPQIKVYKKENGGKYTALNYGIEQSTSELIGCLDADSFVHKDALRRMIRYFDNPETMAVTPAIKIFKPKTFVQGAQYIEYQLGIMAKKLLAYLGAIHVTPGPFTIFRRNVFNKIGMFRHAHNTEDMEIAMRMQKYQLKIDNCHKAYIYTVGPRTAKKLYKQRVRWTHGFIENAIDYRTLFFKRKYGNIAFFTLPFSAASLLSAMTVVALAVWNLAMRAYDVIARAMTVGIHMPRFDMSLIYINTHMSLFLTIAILSLTVTLIVAGRKLSEEKFISKEIIYFFAIYPFIAPFWIGKSVYNTVLKRKTSWR